MTVRELVIKLTLDSLGFRSDVRAAQNGLDRLGAAAGQAGAVASRGLERAGREARAAGSSMMDAADAGSRGFSRLAEVLGKVGMLLGGMAAVHGALSGYMEDVAEIEKTSDMLGMSMEAWQGWQYAAKQAGLEAEDVRDRLMDLGDWMTDLNVNDGGPLKDFAEKTKTSFKDAKGATVSLEEGLMRLADAAGKMGRQQATSWLVQIGFDEKTIPLILKGRKAIEEFVRAGKEQALYHKRDVENARRMREAWQAVTATFSAVAAAVIRVLGPVFDWLAETLGDVVVWVRRNEKSLLVFLGALATVIGAAVTPALWGMAKAALAAVAPFAPLIAAVAAIALVIEDLVVWLDGGESALADFWSMFGTAEEVSARLMAIWEGLKTAFGAVVDLAKALVGWLGSLLTLNMQGLVDNAWKLWEAFGKLGDVLSDMLGWLGEKLRGLLPDWVLDWAGGADSSTPEGRARNAAALEASAAVASEHGVDTGFRAGESARQSGTVSNTRNVTTSINQITVNTQATDAQGIAGDIGNALRNQTAQADGAFGA